MVEMTDVSERRVCQVLAVSRSVARDREEKGKRRRLAVDEVLAARIQRLIAEFPTFGYRRLWAILRHRDGVVVNRKAVYRVLGRKGWFILLPSELKPPVRPCSEGARGGGIDGRGNP